MVNLLREECSKPGLKSWVGINTEIEIKKLNDSLLKFGCSSMCFWQLVNPVFAGSECYHGWAIGHQHSD